MKSRWERVSRARPLLGTLVEISAWGSPDAARMAVASAFAAIERAQELMSAHDPRSDVSRMNRGAHERPIRVHRWTAQVLRFALRLQRDSRGAFDCGIGFHLESAGFLPAGTAAAQADEARADEHTVRVEASNVVRFTRPLCLDLGGIAKGYAVDRAIAALRRAGVSRGVVNAGGDLRAFGCRGFPVLVREPRNCGRLVRLLTLRDGAVATSAGYYSSRSVDGKQVMPILDRTRARFLPARTSVTVAAPSCVLADALTKVAAIRGAAAAPLLRSHAACAFWWSGKELRTTLEASWAPAT